MKKRAKQTQPKLVPPRLMSALEAACGPASTWPGRCAEIAHAAVRAGVKGRSVHGLWHGAIAEGTCFSGRPLAQHEWVKLPDGRVCDPTRWVFEGRAPYIYVGPSDDCYDEGGSALRVAMMPPAPAWDEDQRQFRYNGDSASWCWIEKTLRCDRYYESGCEPGQLCLDQVHWLANLSIEALGPHVGEVYRFLERRNLLALVPIDNQLRYAAEIAPRER